MIQPPSFLNEYPAACSGVCRRRLTKDKCRIADDNRHVLPDHNCYILKTIGKIYESRFYWAWPSGHSHGQEAHI